MPRATATEATYARIADLPLPIPGYNPPDLDPSLPTSPLTASPAPTGFDWA